MKSMFKPQEMEMLVLGSPKLDFEALKKATRYVDGFSSESP